MLFSANSKVQLVKLDIVALTFNKPAALPGWVGEGGENALRRRGITAFDNERIVDYGPFFHS